MPNFLARFDGSGRTPRDMQATALKWLDDNWHTSKYFAISAPVGSGKSALAKAITAAVGGHVITPSNLLIDQYIETYPKHNYLKGKAHYQCTWGVSCEEWMEVAGQEKCDRCPYRECREKALTEPTFFNPMSIYYTRNAADWQQPEALVVDEAHQLPGMVMMLSGTRLRKSLYKFTPNVVNEKFLVPWLDDQIARTRLVAKYYANDPTNLKPVLAELESLVLTRRGMAEDAQNYAIYIEKGVYKRRPEEFLCIKPITPPKFLVDKMLDAKKVILMSGTLMDTDVRALLRDEPYKSLELRSPIPVASRLIHYQPVDFKMNMGTDPKKIVRAIEAVITSNPGLNTIVHVSYATSKRLAPHFTIPILVNEASNKDLILAQFKRDGGVFLAAGCAEGIDLKGDLCRLNIIPQLVFPNLGDPVVTKRKALADGGRWYAIETLKVTIQQAGRSTRAENDFSKTVILDPNFGWVFRSVKNYLPESFKEQIQWSR